MHRSGMREEILKYLKSFYETNERMPTNKEVEFALKINHGYSARTIQVLEDQGKIKRISQGIPYRVVK